MAMGNRSRYLIGYRHHWGMQNSIEAVYEDQNMVAGVVTQKQVVPYVTALRHSYEKRITIALPGASYSYNRDPVTGTIGAQQWSAGVSPGAWNVVPGSNDDAAVTEAYSRAISDFNEKVRGNCDISVDLAQFSQTARLGIEAAKVVRYIYSLKSPSNVIKAIKDAKAFMYREERNVKLRANRIKFNNKWRESMNTSGQLWLTWAYGIKPTMQTIYEAAKFTANHYNNEFAQIVGQGSVKVKLASDNAALGWPDGTYKNAYRSEVSYRYQIGGVLRIPDNPLTQVARLSSLNPVSIAWELVPFSFVVDWFYNVGGYLRDLETALVYSSYFKRGWQTKTMKGRCLTTATRNHGDAYGGYTGSWGFKSDYVVKYRVPLTAYPMPLRPRFNANLGSGRLLNAAALLSVFLKKPKTPPKEVQRSFAKSSTKWGEDPI